MKVKEKSGKIGLKLNIQKTKIMASGPITSWQKDGETMCTLDSQVCGPGFLSKLRPASSRMGLGDRPPE